MVRNKAQRRYSFLTGRLTQVPMNIKEYLPQENQAITQKVYMQLKAINQMVKHKIKR